VSGHVDGTGEVLAVRELDRSWRLELAWHDPSYGRYVCDKASVAVDGVSLTVAGTGLAGSRFWVAVIPHTWSGTTLCRRRPGDPVNLEADLMAKYTERLLDRTAAAAPPAGPTAAAVSPDAGWLAEHGWG
jgi:riboflavin synthase